MADNDDTVPADDVDDKDRASTAVTSGDNDEVDNPILLISVTVTTPSIITFKAINKVLAIF